MSAIIKSSFCIIIVLFCLLTACKESGLNDNNGSAALKTLLVGAPDKVWQLQSADASTVWEHQIGAGWVQYTDQPGHINLTDCVKNNDHIVFNADNTYMQATYTCNLFETNFPLFKQTGGPGKWTLGTDNTLVLENYATYRLVSVTATDLVIANLYGTYYLKSVSKLPYLTPLQQLCGNDAKVWKVSKVKLGGVEQILTAAQLSARLTFNGNGTLLSSYADPVYGQPLTGSWSYNLSQSKYLFAFPSAAQTPAINQTCTVLELTSTAFTYYYFDAQNNYFTISLTPIS